MDKELHRLLSKYKSAFERQDQADQVSKLAVQSYIDNTIWKLFSKTELQNKTLLFNNDQNRINDRKTLQKLISTLFEYNKENEPSKFLDQLHEWMVHIITIHLCIASPQEKKKLLSYFIDTPNISPWAIPLIQYKIEKKSQIDDYLDTIDTVFAQYNEKWTEDDYLMVLDQLAIEYNYKKILEYADQDDSLFQSTRTLINSLLITVHHTTTMNNLVKRIAQAIIQITVLFAEQENYQEQIDGLLCNILYHFYDLKLWFLLPNLPLDLLSTKKLWNVTTYLLQIKDNTEPASLNDVLDDNLPNITRFQYELHANETQGYFMLTCLTNIATSIPQGVDDIGFANNPDHVLSTCIITIISYTLFMTAFIDKDLRELFYKDVRTHLATISQHHSFIISLLFRWTVEYISIMDRMSLYLFHALSLNTWFILQDDLKLIHKLLTAPYQKAPVQLAKYILSHLNYEYSLDTEKPSKSQPWHPRKSTFLPYDVHEEIAYILLDAQPPPPDKRKIALPPMKEVVVDDWAWSIAIKLKLYDCPISPKASDTDQSLDIAFLKKVLNMPDPIEASHHALLVYVSLLLSVTSRHFLRFEGNNGWLKLLVILKRGNPKSVIGAFSDMVPSFVYMHGDDFFHDESLVDFLRCLVEYKPDPMLVKAAAREGWSGVGLMIGSHMWQAQLIDSTSDLLDEDGNGFSYVDLMLHSWLQTVFKRTDWMWQSGYVCILDTLCKLAFTLNKHQLVLDMLKEQQQQMETIKLETTASSPRLARLLKNMVVAEESFTTLLVGEWSLLKVANTPSVESRYHWFAFYVLMMETKMEASIRDEHVLENTTKPIDYFAIYRWLHHILALPVDHVLLPLYCQMFFSLYYQRLDNQRTMGSLFFDKKQDLILKLRDYIASAQTFYGQKIGKEDHAKVLQPMYYAAWLWLGNNELLNLVDLDQFASQYDTKRLKTCYGLSDLDKMDLWLDLVNVETLEQEFLNFSWEGSDKFRTSAVVEETASSNSFLDDQMSLSTTVRRNIKLVTDESTIIPLPSVVINTPTPVRSSSLKY